MYVEHPVKVNRALNKDAVTLALHCIIRDLIYLLGIIKSKWGWGRIKTVCIANVTS